MTLQPDPSPKPNRKLFIILGAAAAAILLLCLCSGIGVGIYYLTRSNPVSTPPKKVPTVVGKWQPSDPAHASDGNIELRSDGTFHIDSPIFPLDGTYSTSGGKLILTTNFMGQRTTATYDYQLSPEDDALTITSTEDGHTTTTTYKRIQ